MLVSPPPGELAVAGMAFSWKPQEGWPRALRGLALGLGIGAGLWCLVWLGLWLLLQ